MCDRIQTSTAPFQRVWLEYWETRGIAYPSVVEYMNATKIINAAKQHGWAYLIVLGFAKCLGVKLDIQRAKDKAWKILKDKHQMRVGYGPFKGMKLNEKVWWSANDRITQTLGIYEEHVLEKLIDLKKQGAERFIDIGAADGYFCVGLAFANIYENIFAFEVQEKGRSFIRENALANGCADKVQIQGEANFTSLSRILSDQQKTSILIDIEGAEYQFLDEKMLELLSGHHVICELHPWVVEDGYKLEEALLNRASKFFDVELIQREAYTPNRFEELSDLSDEERLIAVGESRGKNMQWLVLSPKQSA